MNKRTVFILSTTIILALVAWLLIRNPVQVAEMSESHPHQYGLKVGPAVLGWSSHANSSSARNGYVYMRDVEPSGGNKPLWELALTAKHRLSEVTAEDLKCEFYGMNDPRGPSVFGAAWGGPTILLPEGQILFARLVADPSVIYVVRLAKQGGSNGQGTMQIEYRVFTPPVQLIAALDAGGPARVSSNVRHKP